MWDERDYGIREMNHQQPHQIQSLSKEGDLVCMVGLKESSIVSPFKKWKD